MHQIRQEQMTLAKSEIGKGKKENRMILDTGDNQACDTGECDDVCMMQSEMRRW